MAESKKYEIAVSAVPQYIAEQSDPVRDNYVFAYTITISGGVTEYTGEDTPVLIEHAASLLTAAREAGQNRLCVNMDIF